MDDKRTYKTHKEYGEDMSYENESKHDMEFKGSLDLTKQLEEKNKKIEELKKEIDLMADRQQIEMLEKDRDLELKDKEIGRLMAKINLL